MSVSLTLSKQNVFKQPSHFRCFDLCFKIFLVFEATYLHKSHVKLVVSGMFIVSIDTAIFLSFGFSSTWGVIPKSASNYFEKILILCQEKLSIIKNLEPIFLSFENIEYKTHFREILTFKK